MASLETSTQTNITTAIDGALSGTSFSSARTITISPNVTKPCLSRAGLTVTVTVAASSQVDVPLWNDLSIPLTGRAQFRCE